MTGNILTDTPEEILNNTKRLSVLDSVAQGKFSYCNDTCPHLNSYISKGTIEWTHALTPINQLQDVLVKDSYVINFSYDQSCNLQCPSCRKTLIFHKLDDTEDTVVPQLLKIHNNVKKLVDHLIDKGESVLLSITGSGDPFASDLYWGYLKELSHRVLPDNFRIKLMTNGILMTEQAWDEIKPLWKHICYVGVSIDAVTEDTYRIVRKNGNFTKLKTNLHYFDSLVLANKFTNLVGWQTQFVVQQENYTEIVDYAKWQLSYASLKNIYFNIISHWGHLTIAEFSTMSALDGAVMTELLTDEVFTDSRIKLGNLNAYKRS
jgi:sulfatase maturation enzyme AslB (radical SAM superfamily)